MFEEDVMTLHKRVADFKCFQREYYPEVTEENDNGEWEIGYRQWDEMNDAYLKMIENEIPACVGKELIDDLLYVIARDNECSHLLIQTLQYPQWFEILCRHSVETEYYNARWQFAEQIGKYKGESDIKNLLFSFIESGDEYTERMALQSLCEHFPKQAEEYAVKFWDKNGGDQFEKLRANSV